MHPETSPRPKTRKPPVREKVGVGIYRRTLKDGTVVHDINYLDKTGKLRWKPVRVKPTEAANLKEAQRQRAVLVGTDPAERQAPSRKTFADAAEAWYEHKRSKLRPRTQAYYRDSLDLVLLPYFGRLPLVRIDAESVASFIRVLQAEGLHAVDPQRVVRPLSRSSVQNYTKPLQQTLALAARRGWIASNPWSLLTSDDMPTKNDDEGEQPHEWTSQELDALLAASRKLGTTKTAPECRPYDYSPLLLVASTLGLRLSECLGLRWEDFDRGEGESGALLHVERQWLPPVKVGDARLPARYGKTKTTAGRRTLDLPAGLRDELIRLRLRSRYSQPSDPIFVSRAGTPLTHRNVTLRGFEAARDAAKLPSSLTFHSLRHACASRLIGAGLDPVTVAGVLGHCDATVTLRVYAHQFDRRQKEKGDRVRAALAGVAVGED